MHVGLLSARHKLYKMHVLCPILELSAFIKIIRVLSQSFVDRNDWYREVVIMSFVCLQVLKNASELLVETLHFSQLNVF